MTREEAKALLENDIVDGHVEGNARFMDAFWMAVDALSQDTVPFDFELYQAGLMDMPKGMIDVLDNIRDEIQEEGVRYEDYINADIAKGLYLALEIIDKYKAEKEQL